jgi:hypothetical protein
VIASNIQEIVESAKLKMGQNIYFQFFAGQKLYFRLLQDRLFISSYNNVEFGGQARLLFYFLGHTGQIKYFDPSKFAICVFCNRMKKSRALMKLKESLPGVCCAAIF